MLAHPSSDLILVERLGPITIVRLNRPDKYNALTQEMYSTLDEVLRSADRDHDVRAVIITGVGKAFSAGNDLNDFAIQEDGQAPVQRFLRTIAGMTVPVIAVVNGLAVGLGVTVLLHCDLVFADRTATFQLPFVDIALVPEAASTLLLPRFVGPRRSSELIITGRKLTADEAASWGLINDVPSAPLDRALEVAQAIAAKAPQAVRHSKALSRSTTTDVVARMAEEESLMATQLDSAEFAEVLSARRERRRAVFDARLAETTSEV